MRILLVSLFLVEYAVELANALGEKHDVHLILSKNRAVRTSGNRLEAQLSARVSLTLLPYRFARHRSTLGCALMIIKLYLKIRPHVVHVQECSNPLNLLLFLLRFRPLFTTIHDVELHPGTEQSHLSRKRNAAMRILRQYFYGSIIVHGQKLKALFLTRYNNPSDAVYVVPHGGLFSFIPEIRPNINEEPHTVLFFGRMEKYKGLKCLVEAEPFVSEKIEDFQIVVAGQGPDLTCRKDTLLSNLHFDVHDRFIPLEEVPHYFQRSAAVVLPYTEASQSGIAAMAFAFGIPVIATDVGSLSEVVRTGHNGIVVPAGDPQMLAGAIVSILLDPEKRRRLGKGALKTAHTELSWTRVAKLTENAYRTKTAPSVK
jgi:glycosyltransferase involved in cell wall biosynthesis